MIRDEIFQKSEAPLKSSDSLRSQGAVEDSDRQIQALQAEIQVLTKKLEMAQAISQQRPPKRINRIMNPHATTIHEIKTNNDGRRQLTKLRERMGRNASISTQLVLNALPEDDHQHPLAKRFIEMFKDPASCMDYLGSKQFARDLFKLSKKVQHILEKEPRVVFLQSPAYVFGDIHGNLEDLHFFADHVWGLGISLTAGNFVFLGDYVDRGKNCLECIAYLLSLKLLCPQKVFLLRGNHETRDVNGWEEHYGDRSFMYQCRARFGDDIGYRIWEQTNQVFDRMPLAAVIDQDIFCVHGGIPRPVSADRSCIEDILDVPNVAGINPPYGHEAEMYQQVASDCVWSDPASEDQELNSVDPDSGFGESLRGGGAICFGHKAVTKFLMDQGLSYIMRAHEAHAEGVAVSKGARVFTVFSTSKDHNQGSNAMAGCILVDFDRLQVINRSPAYKNQYVHRRDSVSLAALSDKEIQQRMQLGLVTGVPDTKSESESDEEWEDIDDVDNINDGGDEATYGFYLNSGGTSHHPSQHLFGAGIHKTISLSKLAEDEEEAESYDGDENDDSNAAMQTDVMEA